MATIQDIVTRALRTLGVVPGGKAATGDDAAEALMRLQDIVMSLPGLMSGEWCDVLLSSADDYTASDGERIAAQGYEANITLPATYTDDCGATVPQRDLSRVQVIGEGVWLYVASKGAWAKVDALAITDDSPFGSEDDGGLAALLAVSLAGEYGAQVDELTGNRAARCQQQFRARLYRSGDSRRTEQREQWF